METAPLESILKDHIKFFNLMNYVKDLYTKTIRH